MLDVGAGNPVALSLQLMGSAEDKPVVINFAAAATHVGAFQCDACLEKLCSGGYIGL